MAKIFSASSNPDSLGNKFRTRRFRFFREALKKFPTPVKIIDVGGTEKYWLSQGFGNNNDVQITLVNLIPSTVTCSNMKSVTGNATDLSQYKDNEFDIAFSNSVIEHLYTKENQLKMAAEMMRVGKHHFVQTPNKYFPIEPHYLLPMFQFFPASLKYFILTKTKLSRGKKWNHEFSKQYIDEIRLLSLNEMKQLFPGSKMYFEKVLLLNKSFTAHNLP
ncbi:hypothetical protein LBMAG27_23540 [Bacteroidota bacterium]|nr:hypothetical protein LBMAG27_23540 [Bacteroidota bacterium]